MLLKVVIVIAAVTVAVIVLFVILPPAILLFGMAVTNIFGSWFERCWYWVDDKSKALGKRLE